MKEANHRSKLAHNLHWWRLRYSWYRKKLILRHPPYFINLEPTGFCNLHCKVCSYTHARGKGYVDVALAEKTMAEAARFGISEVRFFLAGEPLFHPYLGDLIKSAKRYGLLTQVHTNATVLDGKRAAVLLESRLDTLSLSFDGETAEEYENIRVGSKFQPTLDNILGFLQLKKAGGHKLPFTTLQVIKLNTTGSFTPPTLTPRFKKLFDGLPVDRFLVIHPFTWPGQEPQDYLRQFGTKYFPCPILWQSLSVGWDGRILGCCGDLNGVQTLGDVRTDRLEEVWNGEKIVEMRRRHINQEPDSIPLCRGCEITKVRVHPALHDLKELFAGKWRAI
jgi:radical SAM protein with 4Fe4S-binding SPASM domain